MVLHLRRAVEANVDWLTAKDMTEAQLQYGFPNFLSSWLVMPILQLRSGTPIWWQAT